MNNASTRVKAIGMTNPQLKNITILLALSYSSSCLSSQTASASEVSSILMRSGLLNWAYSFNCRGGGGGGGGSERERQWIYSLATCNVRVWKCMAKSKKTSRDDGIKQFSIQPHLTYLSTQYMYNEEKYVRCCILNCFMPSSLLACFLTFCCSAIPISPYSGGESLVSFPT